jgi:hypothetical protein
MTDSMSPAVEPPVAPVPPEAEDAEMTWKASVEYLAVFGVCSFFDFNWQTTFKTKMREKGADPLRIEVVSNPEPVAPATTSPLVAKVIGRPISTVNGVVYDSIRIIRVADELEAGDYEFKFRVVDTKDQKTDVTFTLTVK